MRGAMRPFISGAATLAAIACITSTLGAQAVLSRLGVSQQDADDRFVEALQGGASPSVAARAFLALPASARAATVTEVVALARTYYTSAAFKKAWAEAREANKPDAPAGSADAAIARQKAEQEKAVADARKMLDSLPPDQRKAVEESMKQAQSTMNDPAFQAKQAEMAQNMNADDKKKYQGDLKEWEKNYPVDPSPVIARRLRDVLAQTADVNFDAKLVAREGTRVFADPQYESKPSQWKIAYRAGREATTSARAAAAAWLKELGQ